ncbi:MAG: polysaccharide deacetylase family protein [Candidatus Krumholzibacteriota bacterium]|nr:polysaccharide deacetylase family protein [Candidatus Krumholzibacteriota bacterium]
MSWFLAPVLIVITVLAVFCTWKIRWGPPRVDIPKVLAFHKVTGFELGGTWITRKRFASSLDFLLDSGFTFIGEDSYLDAVTGRRVSSGREVLLTFDDGYRMILDNAIPALEERNIPALIFLVTSYAGRENRWELQLPGRKFDHMGWDEVSDLYKRGFSFGSHGRSHRDLTRLGVDDLRQELSISKSVIEEVTSGKVRTLSYPFGRSNAMVREEAREARYEAAFTLYPSGRNSEIDRFDLRREGVWIIDSRRSIGNKLGLGSLFWLEDLKGRSINSVASLTPLLKGDSPFKKIC